MNTSDRSKLEKLLPHYVEKHGIDHVSQLVEKFGPQFLAGLIASERSNFPHVETFSNSSGVQATVIDNLPEPPKAGEAITPPQPTAAAWPETIKLWPMVALWAIKANRGGAFRVWLLAKALDQAGSGWISRAQLWGFIGELGIGERKRRRWITDSLSVGLIAESKRRGGEEVYILSSLAAAAEKLECKTIGRPALLTVNRLISEGWRSYVWSAYLATLKGRPMSQACKESVTGIEKRTQRNYQNGYRRKGKNGEVVEILPPFGEARRNYAKTSLTADHLAGVKEHGRQSAFVTRGRAWKHRIPDIHEADYFFRHFVMFRLPDIRTVPIFVSQPSPKGRSRKAQKQLNHSFSLERVKAGAIVRLFHESLEGVEGALRKLARADIPPWERPGELFQLAKAGATTNLWRPVAVEAY